MDSSVIVHCSLWDLYGLGGDAGFPHDSDLRCALYCYVVFYDFKIERQTSLFFLYYLTQYS